MKLFIVAALVAVAASSAIPAYSRWRAYGPRRAPSYHQPFYKEPHYYAKPYQFDYAVNDHYSGAVFSKNEKSDAKTTNGYYSVNLPDGRVQTVKYVADNVGYGGFNADVTYSGKPYYDEFKPAYRPDYKPIYKTAYKPWY